jgi:hypothetical protein
MTLNKMKIRYFLLRVENWKFILKKSFKVEISSSRNFGRSKKGKYLELKNLYLMNQDNSAYELARYQMFYL